MTNLYAVIMAGGAGTRFWPASRARMPKQLLPLGADPDEPLLAATVRRISGLLDIDHVYIATGAHLVEPTLSRIPSLRDAHLLAEPAPRNTAPCIGWAVSTIARRDPEAVVMVLPADHYIRDETAFRTVLEHAVDEARHGSLVTVGIVPTRPDTGFGYIEVGEPRSPHSRTVARFVEKPNRSCAEDYVASGRYLWNAGMFFFQARTMRSAIETHLPDLASALALLDLAAKEGREAEELAHVFPRLPSISIDYGVMERSDNIRVVPGDFGWSDVGSWESAWELSPKDAHGNAAPVDAILVDTKGSLVVDRRATTARKVYGVVGMQDVIVVDTDDALLVLPRERCQDAKLVVEALRKQACDIL